MKLKRADAQRLFGMLDTLDHKLTTIREKFDLLSGRIAQMAYQREKDRDVLTTRAPKPPKVMEWGETGNGASRPSGRMKAPDRLVTALRQGNVAGPEAVKLAGWKNGRNVPAKLERVAKANSMRLVRTGKGSSMRYQLR